MYIEWILLYEEHGLTGVEHGRMKTSKMDLSKQKRMPFG